MELLRKMEKVTKKKKEEIEQMRMSIFREFEGKSITRWQMFHQHCINTYYKFKTKITKKNYVKHIIPDFEFHKHKRHTFIHYTFKEKLFVPIVFFIEKYLNKHIIKERTDIPNEVYNKNFFVMWDTFDEAMKEWYFKYNKAKDAATPEGREKLEKLWKKRETEHRHWYGIPKFFLRLMFTVMLEDTAYREQFNMLMFKIQGNMNKVWNPEVEHTFPLYINKYDQSIPYFTKWMELHGKEGKIEINVKKNQNIKQPVMDTSFSVLLDGDTHPLHINKDILSMIKYIDWMKANGKDGKIEIEIKKDPNYKGGE